MNSIFNEKRQSVIFVLFGVNVHFLLYLTAVTGAIKIHVDNIHQSGINK